MESALRYLQLLPLLHRLGWCNIFRALGHRFLLRTGLHPVCKLKAEPSPGNFFSAVSGARPLPASHAWLGSIRYFDWLTFDAKAKPPNWFGRPITGLGEWPFKQPWWQAESAEVEKGDIKEIWDLSRFHWVISMAQRAANGDASELQRLNDWLSDWTHQNPCFFGPNWRCGQEASIRVMNLAVAALILNQVSRPLPALVACLRAHLVRISSTLSYAISQDNNHGVLEAAGLFVGGEWLCVLGENGQARAWANQGRKWLENRSQRLISKDGSFSMYSVTYHREFLDALSFVEVWRRRLNLPGFSPKFVKRVAAAARWLKAFTHSTTGDAPNIGANDGTRLFPFTDSNYRDFRPSVQLACVLFCGDKAYDAGPWDIALNWLGIPLPNGTLPADVSRQFDDGGFVVLRGSPFDVQAYMRYPRFRFRPSQPDLLHLDLWVRGENILRDAGTYSYATDQHWLSYFGGTVSHNTVQFDGRNQMPRVGKFLLGDWLQTDWLKGTQEINESVRFGAGYTDKFGARHRRRLTLERNFLRVEDDIEGFTKSAVLRWRLAPLQWRLEGASDSPLLINTQNNKLQIHVDSNVPIVRCELVMGWESLRYQEKTAVSVLEIEVRQLGSLITEVSWNS